MLPAVKVFAVAALLGGGAVGTFALAGGFGTGGNGSGNEKATTQVAATENAKPAVTEPVAPAPGVTTSTVTALTEGGVARDGSNTLEPEVKQEVGVEAQRSAGLVSDGQTQQQAVLQDSSLPQKVDSDSSGELGVAAGEKTELGDDVQDTTHSGPKGTKAADLEGGQNDAGAGKTNISSGEITNSAENSLSGDQVETEEGRSGLDGTPDSSPSGDSPVASPTVQQENLGAGQGGNGSLPASVSNPESTGDNGVVKNTEQTVTSSHAGNKGDDVGGTGTDGANTITTSGEEETRTASGGEGAGSA